MGNLWNTRFKWTANLRAQSNKATNVIALVHSYKTETIIKLFGQNITFSSKRRFIPNVGNRKMHTFRILDFLRLFKAFSG